ncbi:formimidoylglutamase [Sphingobacterium sp. SYP-B4668]|uniref:formimidoylglutamase n=1 Tax=Sphingobacterium sp. SYP-B4668 TaxID=2996035 RepID=UPI0022DD06F9|nr:formimidoylglutamase [Sphingobacterium sp. SYP-B4668]
MENILDSFYYQLADENDWEGRVDGDSTAYLRWHQRIVVADLRTDKPSWNGGYVLLGFCCDEGVRRNQGRVGAVGGPVAIRDVLRNLPVHHESALYDGGSIVCLDGHLERAQQALAAAVELIIKGGGFPIVLGGGHEVTYGHFQGIDRCFGADRTIGIINFDAHFDLRAPQGGTSTSGTGFYEIAQDLDSKDCEMAYLAIGIQQISNTKLLFNTATELGVEYILADELRMKNDITEHLGKIDNFIQRCDVVYLTVDLDVFAAAYAPGVSATAFCGIVPDDVFFQMFYRILHSGKLISLDIAELNPLYDVDSRTAKLGADLVFRLLSKDI